MTTTQQPTFDYGEPWGFDGENWITDARNKEILNLDSIHSRNARRLIDCVNACIGMVDPAAEIQAMREAMRETADILAQIPDAYDNRFFRAGQWANAALTKLQPFIAP